MKQKMTIHRALAELKLLDAKIEKGIKDIYPIGIIKKGGKVDGWFDEAEFKKSAQSSYASVNDLIQRKAAVKSAIVKANCETKVKIGDNEMTIADAIAFKKVVEHKKQLMDVLKSKHTGVVGVLNKNNEAVNKNCEALLSHVMGKDNVKATDGDIDAISKPYLENNLFTLVDPLEILKRVEAMEKEIGEFDTNIDAALSEINAVTFIEV